MPVCHKSQCIHGFSRTLKVWNRITIRHLIPCSYLIGGIESDPGHTTSDSINLKESYKVTDSIGSKEELVLITVNKHKKEMTVL